ncbi:MAG: hypothetical protein ABR579_11670, partial [Actinomycetota bacterium]
AGIAARRRLPVAPAPGDWDLNCGRGEPRAHRGNGFSDPVVMAAELHATAMSVGSRTHMASCRRPWRVIPNKLDLPYPQGIVSLVFNFT